jgi:type III pantothenate kinase
MIVCLDVGNTHIFGGVFADDKLIFSFRHVTDKGSTSDQIGVFLKNLLRENNIAYNEIKQIGISSVVPSVDYSLRAACKKYFNIEPFILRSETKTAISLKNLQHNETGADLIAGAIAASHYYPNKNLIVIDLGTASTITAIAKNKEFLGVSILSGLKISMTSLSNNTAKLFPVEIQKPEKITGRFTTEALQSGLYYGHLGAIKEITTRIIQEVFNTEKPLLIATGGFASLFAKENIFDVIVPDLVLHGIRLALQDQ